jgi:hypothetical protein
MICPRLPGLSATCHCRIGARCHDRRVHHMSTLMTATYPLKSMAEISFGSLGSGKINTQTYFSLEEKTSRVKDLTTCGLQRSMAEIPSWLWTSGKSNLKPHFPSALLPGAGDLLTRGPHRSMTEIPLGLRALGKSKLKLISPISFYPELAIN